ncbi:hypothetical protein COY32_05230, partial [candidate division WWE3 bacterium CG_4_10_14_0_2_um_filter_41_14]
EDIRVVYQPNTTTAKSINYYFDPASGTTCATSTATKIYFPLQADMSNGSSTTYYYLYYDNKHAVDESSVDAFDIGNKQALLHCGFRGDTTCINADGVETPSAESGAVRYSGGKSALAFDGGGDYVSVSDVNNSLDISYDLTITAWIKPTSNSSEIIVAKQPSFSGANLPGNYEFRIVNGKLQLGYEYSAPYIYVFYTGSADIVTDVWSYVVVTRSREDGGVVFYINGAVDAARSDNGIATLVNNSALRIGLRADSYGSYSGLMDEVAIYNRALSATEIADLYNGGIGKPVVPDESVVGLWHFDENGDDPRNTGKAIDASGNGNHGTITGAKYTAGLIGVDDDDGETTTGTIPGINYAGHEGVFIEEGTVNKITNPSFENSTAYNTNWGAPSVFKYDSTADTFTAGMAKRNSAGPFASGVSIQGGTTASSQSDTASYSTGSQIAGTFYSNFDQKQGTIALWVTPEWNGNDGNNHMFWVNGATGTNYLYKAADSNLKFLINAQIAATVNVSSWIAGTTYSVVVRWDSINTLDGTNYASISVNDSHTFADSDNSGTHGFPSTMEIGAQNSANSANAIIEGLTIYRRPLFDGTYGIDVGNGDEINQIYNSGTGKDPTLVTGSWDVVFALPTNASTGALATGTGNAWSHPHASNLLYTSTTNTGGFMMNGEMDDDGWSDEGAVANVDSVEFNGSTTRIDAGSDSSLDNLASGAFTVEAWVRPDGVGQNSYNAIAGKYGSNAGWLAMLFLGTRMYTNVPCSTSGASGIEPGGGANLNEWHHYTWTFDNNGDRIMRGWRDGQLVVSSSACSGDVLSDASLNFEIGETNGNYASDGSIAWVRISNNVRYSTTFSPASRWAPPSPDANTVGQWNMADGSGATVTNTGSCGGTASNCNGTLSNGTWNDGGALSTSEKVFAGGYKFTSTGTANQGIYRTFTATNGGDYVLRALGHSDGTCSPQVKITRADGSTTLTTLSGTTTSTRTDPDVYIFTWESPAAEANQVQLINTASSGTCYWHQVEVLSNLITNPSMETGAGDPWIPTGWSNANGTGVGALIQSGDVHSGLYSLQAGGLNGLQGIVHNPNSIDGIGKFFNVSGFIKDTNNSLRIQMYNGQASLQKQSGGTFLLTSNTGSWKHMMGVARQANQDAGQWDKRLSLQNGTGYWDDIYSFQLSDVSLTVTPASEANSLEST